jgi:hypothetical protein
VSPGGLRQGFLNLIELNLKLNLSLLSHLNLDLGLNLAELPVLPQILIGSLETISQGDLRNKPQ